MLKTLDEVQVRKAQVTDHAAVIDIVKATNFFYPVEIEVACEVFNDAAMQKTGCTYQSYVAEVNGQVAGWICFGATQGTLGTFDVYWIAVAPAQQRNRIGTKLLHFAEAKIGEQEGRMIVIESSGSEKFIPTRNFYERNGYRLAAEVEEFYAPGDDKLIFLKKLAMPTP